METPVVYNKKVCCYVWPHFAIHISAAVTEFPTWFDKMASAKGIKKQEDKHIAVNRLTTGKAEL